MKRYSLLRDRNTGEKALLDTFGGEWIRYEDHVEAMKRIAGAPVAQGLTSQRIEEIAKAYFHQDDTELADIKTAIRTALHEAAAPSASAQQAEPVAWQAITAAIYAVGGEAARRGEMFPQTRDEQNEDRKAVHRVAEMVEWYATKGGAVAMSLDGWPKIAAPAPVASPEQHPDDVAVDMFAKAMKGKLAQARAKSRSGWQTCNKYELSNMLRDHVEKGDPRDVANFCMFLHALGHPIQIAPSASPWVSINPAATLADRLDELPEINFSNYDQGDVEALQAWAIEAYTLLNASPAPTNVKKEG